MSFRIGISGKIYQPALVVQVIQIFLVPSTLHLETVKININ